MGSCIYFQMQDSQIYSLIKIFMLNASHFDNNIHKLPPDIQDLVNKKQKFLNMGFNSKSIEECKIPTSPM